MTSEQVYSKLFNVLIAGIAVLGAVLLSPQPKPVVVPVPPAVVVPGPATTPLVVPAAPSVPPAPRAEPELVIVTDAAGKRITDKAIEEVAGKLAVGQWRIEAIPKPGDVGWKRSLVVSDLDTPPVPPVVVVPPPVVVQPPPVVVTPPVQPTAATYVYEKDDTAIPVPVLAAIDKLNRERKIIANSFEQDTKDGQGEVPDQYKVPLQAAKAAGLPALVITAGATVLKVVKNPKTEAEVMEALAL